MMQERKERPALVRFETVAQEDKAASQAAGHYVAKDVDYALITPPYSKDVMKHKVKDWFPNLEQKVAMGQMPQEWLDLYKKQYEAWKNGQEIPVLGTPIKGWPVISPAQTETLIAMGVRTVEDLAQINDEGIRRVGMGAVDLKNKAQAWLSSAKDLGPVVMENAQLKQQVAVLEGSVSTLTKQVESLMVALQTKNVAAPLAPEAAEIVADDIIDREDTQPRRRKQPA